MSSTQIVCPHCGSMLNFGGPVPAGAQVRCLLCQQVFAAESGVHVPVSATPMPEAPKRPKPGVLVAEAAKPERPKPMATAPTPPHAPAAPPRSASRGASWLAVIALLLLLLGGSAYLTWHVMQTDASRGPDPVAVAKTGNPAKKAPDQVKKSGAAKSSKPAENIAKQPGEDGPDDLQARRIKEAQKNQLTRKLAANPAGATPEPELVPNTPATPVSTFPGLEAPRINGAIDKGVAYLKSTQNPTGDWGGLDGHIIGYTSLGGLALLECNVSPKDKSVQRAAAYIRAHLSEYRATYDFATAILFLDRLGERRDRHLIQGAALQLLAGQHDCGGWTYDADPLSPQEMQQLYAFLQTNAPAPAKNKTPKAHADGEEPPPAKDPNAPFEQLRKLIDKKAPGKGKPIGKESLPPRLRNLPVVKYFGQAKGTLKLASESFSDNSNTQFALMALWVAKRHGIACEPCFIVAHQRFVDWQVRDDSGWSYNKDGTSTPPMACVGLIALAMGHGVAPDILKDDPKKIVIRPALQDPRIKAGLKYLAKNVGTPSREKEPNFPLLDFYYLWSLERVAMLYDLKTIEGKDWYSWGAQMLVGTQDANGTWPVGSYPGCAPHVNTCLALLFLRRSNLVQDLTHNLRLYAAVRDPGN